MLDILYKAIAEELKSQRAKDIFATYGLEDVAHVDLFNNQYLYEESERAYPLPAVFVEFSEATIRQQGRNTDASQELVNLHLESKELGSTRYRTIDSQRMEKALEHLRLVAAVNEVVKGISHPAFSRLIGIGRKLDSDHEGVPVHIISYSTSLHDLSCDSWKALTETAGAGLELGKRVMRQ
ncbi:hypothetical protein V6R21_18975 [Limibacter armeniacum]|uniref:hypothetical protein n=1 Tax=Limibacter armeniacum TaxID=466084 RepID=UPI002FE5BAC8